MDNITLTLEAKTIPVDLVRKTRAEEIAELPDYLQVKMNMPEGLVMVNYGPNRPPYENRLYPWFKTNADGSAAGIYTYVAIAATEVDYDAETETTNWKAFLPGGTAAEVLANVAAAQSAALAAQRDATAAQQMITSGESLVGAQDAATAAAYVAATNAKNDAIAAALGFKVLSGTGNISQNGIPVGTLYNYLDGANIVNFATPFTQVPTLLSSMTANTSNLPLLPVRWILHPNLTGFTAAGIVYAVAGETSINLDITLSWIAIGK